MIRNRWNDKKADIQGLKKQTSSLLNCAWEKGYVAGFDDGYKTGRQAEERPKGKWIKHSTYKGVLICSHCHQGSNRFYDTFEFCPNCGADMRGEENG